jgi:hypothetical protein
MTCPNSSRPKKARNVKSKAKNMHIIFFDIKGIIHKEFVLSGQTINSAYYHVSQRIRNPGNYGWLLVSFSQG